MSQGAPLFVLDFFFAEYFFRPFRLSLAPTNYPWVSEDEYENDWSSSEEKTQHTLTVLTCSILTDVYSPGDVRMAAGLYYYYGDCNSQEAQAQIKENFIRLLNASGLIEDCQEIFPRDRCKPENVSVTCGNVTSRRRRASGILALYLGPLHMNPF